MRSAILLLLISEMIATLGVAAVILYGFRRRDREKFLLWFGLFLRYSMQSFLSPGILPFAWALDSRKRSDLPSTISSAYPQLFPGCCSLKISTDEDGVIRFRWADRDLLRGRDLSQQTGITHQHHSRLILPPRAVLVILGADSARPWDSCWIQTSAFAAQTNPVYRVDCRFYAGFDGSSAAAASRGLACRC